MNKDKFQVGDLVVMMEWNEHEWGYGKRGVGLVIGARKLGHGCLDDTKQEVYWLKSGRTDEAWPISLMKLSIPQEEQNE